MVEYHPKWFMHKLFIIHFYIREDMHMRFHERIIDDLQAHQPDHGGCQVLGSPEILFTRWRSFLRSHKKGTEENMSRLRPNMSALDYYW